MDYSIFKFGAIYLDNEIQPVPQHPIASGDIPKYDGKATISFGTAGSEDSITWIKLNGSNVLAADRVLLANVSWENLDKNGFIMGASIQIDEQRFRCRLLQVGEKGNVPNEWDEMLNKICEDNILWNWEKMFFWGSDASAYNTSARAVRGYHSARYWSSGNATTRDATVGFRPVLEPLPSDVPAPNINLEGAEFQLSRLPGNDAFCPILQPIQEDVFKGIPVRGEVKMYTFTEDGRPVHMNKPVKDPTKLTLTDRYYGDEFLVPWVVSDGVAVASQSLNQQL